MSHSILTPGVTPFVNPQDVQALNQLIFMAEPEELHKTMRTLMRGWIASDCIQEQEAHERADLFYHFECLLEFLRVLEKNSLTPEKQSTL